MCMRSWALRRRNCVRRTIDVEAVLDVVLAEVVETERGGHAVDEHDVVDAERLFERRLPVELGEHRVRRCRRLCSVDLDAQPVRRSDRFLTSSMSLILPSITSSLMRPMTRSGPTRKGSSVTTMRLAPAPLQRSHLDLGPHADRAATGVVGLADAVVDDDAAGGEVGSGQHRQQFVEGGSGPALGQHQLDGVVHFAQVVRGHVGGHADRDAGGAVDQQVGQQRRQVDAARVVSPS